MRTWDQLTFEEQEAFQRELQMDIEKGDLGAVAARTISNDVDIDWVNPETGLPLLHYAVGRNQVEIVRHLLEKGAKVTADRNGRWPSILALQCECDDAILDMIEDAESGIAADEKPVQIDEAPFWFSIEIPEAVSLGRLKLAQEIGPGAEVSIDRSGLVSVRSANAKALSEALKVLNYLFDLNLSPEDMNFERKASAVIEKKS